MPSRAILQVVQGAIGRKQFVFDEHDTFVFGRMPDCHACLPDDDQVSRHHFLLEVNPPEACLRDLGSLNGTHVNGVKYGGRKKGETPEEGAQRKYPEVNLKDGDRIQAGQTVLAVRIEALAVCCECGSPIADSDRAKCAWVGGTFICTECYHKAEVLAMRQPAKEPVRCQKCGKDVTDEAGWQKDYVCRDCRQKAEADPMELLNQLLQQAKRDLPAIQGFEVERVLGQGGFGAVYLAMRKSHPQPVALKIMLARKAVQEDAREKFRREIEVMRQLKHGNIVTLLEHGSTGEAFYFVMEFCDRGSVADLMARRGGKLSSAEAGPILRQCLAGLAFAHQRGFVHRDLKPHNLLLQRSPQTAKVGDFGFAKNFQKAGFSGMTMTGNCAGTPYFMPREQVINFKYVKPVSDVWSMGATFYNMLTGQFPRDYPRGVDPIEVILGGKIIPIRKRDASIPARLAEVIDRAVANDPKQRYQDAQEMQNALARAL